MNESKHAAMIQEVKCYRSVNVSLASEGGYTRRSGYSFYGCRDRSILDKNRGIFASQIASDYRTRGRLKLIRR